MTQADYVALDRRLRTLEAKANLAPKTTSTSSASSAVSTTASAASGGSGFLDSPLVVDQGNGAQDWTSFGLPSDVPSSATGVVLQWSISLAGNPASPPVAGERRIEARASDGASAFLVASIDLDPGYSLGGTAIVPCENGSIEYRFASTGTGNWQIALTGWIL